MQEETDDEDSAILCSLPSSHLLFIITSKRSIEVLFLVIGNNNFISSHGQEMHFLSAS